MNFFKKLFGKGAAKTGSPEELVNETLSGVIERADLELSYEAKTENDIVHVDLFGEDEPLLREKDGMLLDAFQFFTKRVVQHHFPDLRVDVVFDNNGFREEANDALIQLAEKLKEAVLDKNKSMYVKALPPKERKIIHQYLASDERVKSRSVGDGHYKRIKIYPAKGGGRGFEAEGEAHEVAE